MAGGAPSITLRPGRPADIPFIMATERLPGYEALVGRWDEARHRAGLADAHLTYLVAERDNRPVGFAILKDLHAPERSALLKRIALAEPGRGTGRAVLDAILDHVFTASETHRFHLGHFPENIRARKAYEAVGFVAEGVARGSAFFGGVFRDEAIMAILRPEWMARRSQA